MLFLLNSLDASRLSEVDLMAGREDKSIILYGDAAYYASEAMVGKLAPLDFDEIFVFQDALSARNISADQSVEAIGQDKIATIILNDHDRVVSL